MKKLPIIIVFAVLLLATSIMMFFRTATAPIVPKKTDAKMSVVASFYPVYFLAKEIGGVNADVVNITPRGVEPHDYEPTPKQMVDVERARLLVLLGGSFEAWAEKANVSNFAVVRAADGVFSRPGANASGEYDIHVWLSPAKYIQMIPRITDGYAKADPENAAYYRNRAATLAAKIGVLDTDMRVGLAECVRRDIVTSHSAFGYLAEEYKLRQIGLMGVVLDGEPTGKDLAEAARFAKKSGVTHIFFESLVSPKLAETIAKEVGAKTLVLDPLEGISEDASRNGEDYFSVMRKNLTNLRIALQCQ